MNNKKIVVTSRSFSAHPKLREELLSLFPNTKFNDQGAIVGEKDLAEFLSGADGAIVALDPIKLSLLNQCPDLKLYQNLGWGWIMWIEKLVKVQVYQLVGPVV